MNIRWILIRKTCLAISAEDKPGLPPEVRGGGQKSPVPAHQKAGGQRDEVRLEGVRRSGGQESEDPMLQLLGQGRKGEHPHQAKYTRLLTWNFNIKILHKGSKTFFFC